MWNVTKAFEEGLTGVLLSIDSVIYWAVSKLYGLFIDIASVRVFEQEAINTFANRIYNLMGVIMLFVIAYSILTAIVDPSKFTKGETSVGKIVLNVVTSLIMIAFMPTIFNYAYTVQNILITNNVLGSILLGQENTDPSEIEMELSPENLTEDQIKQYKEEYNLIENSDGTYSYYVDLATYNVKKHGNIMALSILNAFLNPNNIEVTSSSSKYVNLGLISFGSSISYLGCAVGIGMGIFVGVGGALASFGIGSGVSIPAGFNIAAAACTIGGAVTVGAQTVFDITSTDLTWSQGVTYVRNTGDFLLLTSFTPQVNEGIINYTPIISTICGLILLWVILSFCLDLGIRAVKLVFYQLIAPIPILLRIIPKEQKIFNNWLKCVLATYFEVFVRLAIIYCITFLASNISSLSMDKLGSFGKAIIIMGLVAFAKAAPKLISEVTGISSGNLSLGIKDKLAAGGALFAGAAVGGGLVAGLRNGVSAWQNTDGSRGRKIANAFKSGVGGLGSGIVRSGYAARGAKGFGDVKTAALSGALNANQKAFQRATYKKDHQGGYLTTYKSTTGSKKDKFKAAMQAGVAGGHLYDLGTSFKDFATGGAEQYKKAIDEAKKFQSLVSDLDKETLALMKKFDGTAMVSDMTKAGAWKGTAAEIAAMKSYLASYAGMGLEEMRVAIEAEAQEDDFVDEASRIAHAKKVTLLRKMLSQVEAESKLELQTAIASRDASAIYAKGISDVSKATVINDKIEDLNKTYQRMGNTVTYTKEVVDTATGKIVAQTETLGKIDMSNAGKSIDDLNSAFKAVEYANLAKANEIEERQMKKKKNNS